MLQRVVLILASCLLFPALGFAAAGKTLPPSVTLTPTVGGLVTTTGKHINLEPLYGIKLGYDRDGQNIADSIDVEATLNYFGSSTNSESGPPHGYMLRLDALYPFTPGKTWVPFVAAGIGGSNIRTDEKSYDLNGRSNLLINYGAGLKYFLDNNLALRLDARHIIIYEHMSTKDNVEVSLGLTYLFGREPRKKPTKTKEVAPATAIPVLQDIDTDKSKSGPAEPGAAPPATPPPPAAAPGAASPGGQKAAPESKTPQAAPAAAPAGSAPAAGNSSVPGSTTAPPAGTPPATGTAPATKNPNPQPPPGGTVQ